MKAEDFDVILTQRTERMKATLARKASEYARDGDRLSNFKDAARFQDIGPEMACWNFLMKHLVSIQDMVRASQYGKAFPAEMWDEKIGDAINYLVLLEAVIADITARREAGNALC